MKLMYAIWAGGSSEDLSAALRGPVAESLTVAGAQGIQVNISDVAVVDAMLRLTTFDRPVVAVVSVWADGVRAFDQVLAESADGVAGWEVDERVVMKPPVAPAGARQPGLANLAFLRRPGSMSLDAWLDRWRNHHTQVAMDSQATFGYVQNTVLRPVVSDSPRVDAIVEELFPIEALTDWHAFYGSGGDEAELSRRMTAMLDSVVMFGADRDIDVVPTSRYVVSGG